MGKKAVKFGGTSLASAEQMKKAAAIVHRDAARQVVVVSAPGKRSPNDVKITDLLYECYGAQGEEKEKLFFRITSRIDEIVRELALPLDFTDDYKKMREPSVTKDDFVSRGEYFCAKIMAALLQYEFIDAADCIFFHEDGTLDEEMTYAVMTELLDEHPCVVIPGFYGRRKGGGVKTFSRGGSDITGAIAAVAAGAFVYENFTDVSGVLVASPAIVEDPKRVDVISYRELRRLSYMGASVFHEDAVFPVCRAGIPIMILNTNHPEEGGTRIVSKKEKTGAVCGIAGKTGFVRLAIRRQHLGEDAVHFSSFMSVLAALGLSVYGVASTADDVCVILRDEEFEAARDLLFFAIRPLSPEVICVQRHLALLCVVGDTLAQEIPPLLLSALADLGERPVFLESGADTLGLTVAVREEALFFAIRGIYRRLKAEGML